jgi:hypothetical protein
MLSDFLTLEVYFGSEQAAQYFEDLVKRYGPKRVEKAIKNGDLRCTKTCMGDKVVMWLSSQGRDKALSSI